MAKKGKKKGGGKYRAAKAKTYMLTARVLRTEAEKLRRLARAKGVSLSEFVRLRVLGKDSKIVGKSSPIAKGPKRAKVRKAAKPAKPKRRKTAKVVSISKARTAARKRRKKLVETSAALDAQQAQGDRQEAQTEAAAS